MRLRSGFGAVTLGVAALLAVPSTGLTAEWQERWEKVVAAAKKEGEISCTCIPVPFVRRLIETEWAKAYPEIKLTYSPATLPEIEPQITQERRAGQYIRDIYVWGSSPEMYIWDDQGFLANLRPLIILPENADESKWFGGFDSRFQDEEKRSVFAITAPLQSMTVRRDLVPASEFALPADLLKPQFKGKWVVWDPRFGGAGANVLGWWNFLFGLEGEKGVRALLAHDPVVVPGPGRNAVTQMFRNNIPINFANTNEADLIPFRNAGFPINVELLGREPTQAFLGAGSFGVLIFKDAPHANAATVFLNWIMSRDVAIAIVSKSDVSARTDVDVSEDRLRGTPIPGARYTFSGQTEESIKKYRIPAMNVAREVLK
jgi:ABC-type Fe3+ transport system substrate-binding protein